MKALVYISLPLLLWSCISSRSGHSGKIPYYRPLADSMLSHALDHEGLYALLDTIKPISSIKYLSYPIAKDSTHSATDHRVVKHPSYLDSIVLYQRICAQLSNDKVRFVVVPFQRADKGRRQLEIYAVNLYKFKSKIREYASFFGQFGITPESDPAQVITIIECEAKYDRWRGYGYLFGYPGYAVDFFVNAGQQQDSTGQFVERSFFQIPVFASREGHFTYALPKDHPPGLTDTLLYQQSIKVLSRYKELRKQYARDNGIRAAKLWKRNIP